MKRSKAIFYNLMLMTAVTLIMRFIGVSFNVYLTAKLGAGGMGLYSLIMSVGGFGVTFATSGVNLASTRLCASAIGSGSMVDIRRSMTRCIAYSLCFGVSATLLFFALAEPISLYLLGDSRCIMAIRVFAVGLPFLSLSSALNGYFCAVRRVYKNAIEQVFEQVLSIGFTVYLISLMLPRGVEYACIALILGGVISEFLSFLLFFVLYRVDLMHHIDKSGKREVGLTKKLLNISLPIAFSAYIRSILVSVEHMLIPRGLRANGASADKALCAYGTLQGMVMPIVLFPMAIVGAFSGLLVPEITESIAREEVMRVNRMVSRVIQLTLAFAIGCSGIMLCYSHELGIMIYNSSEAGIFIRAIAPLIPVMYLDHVVDGMLKGIGEQLYSMKVNIFDAFCSVVLVYFLTPKWGIYGYIICIFAMEVLNASLSIVRLLQRCDVKVEIVRWVIKPLICVIGSTSITNIIMSFDFMGSLSRIWYSCIGIVICIIIYMILLRITRSFNGDDIKWLKNAVK